MNEDGEGYPIYRMNEIHNMLCDSEVSKFANVTENEKRTFCLNDRDVVFNRTNSFEWVGRTGLYKKNDNRDFLFASYLVRFIPNQQVLLPEYLTAFLNSIYGVSDIKRRARQSINQTNVNPEEVKAIEIPLFSLVFQNKLKTAFDDACVNLSKSENIYSNANSILLNELGLENFKPNSKGVNIKTFSESYGTTGRIDAEYYQPKYDIIEKSIRNYFNGFATLNDFTENYSTGFPYKSDSYISEGGIPLIRINNINKGYLDISNAVQIPLTDIVLSPKDLAKENDLLISMSGTIGNTCRIPKGTKAVINQRIMRITPKNFNNEVLPMIINSPIGEYQLNRIGTGGVQTNISSTDIKQILIPKIKEDVQQQIAKLIKQSFLLKKQSEHLLEVAKRAVEIAIEEGEENAFNYINNETK